MKLKTKNVSMIYQCLLILLLFIGFAGAIIFADLGRSHIIHRFESLVFMFLFFSVMVVAIGTYYLKYTRYQ